MKYKWTGQDTTILVQGKITGPTKQDATPLLFLWLTSVDLPQQHPGKATPGYLELLRTHCTSFC